MGWPEAEDELLHGPRGRRLCCELLDDSHRLLGLSYSAGGQLTPELLGDLEVAVAGAIELTDSALLAALADSVVAARYWQEPDEADRALEASQAQAILRPVARTLASTPAAQWWTTPIALDQQRYVQWLGDPEFDSPALTGAQGQLNAWRSAALADERQARGRPADPSAPWSGSWWSTPTHTQLVKTTRSRPGLGAAGLLLIEDTLGWSAARCWPLAAPPACRVFEITGPDDWTDLVTRYPLEVTLSRRHDWWRVTGRDGPWLIPDWAGVAGDYDGVHLTVAGYLVTAGRALLLDQAATMLAGWAPDETYWLSDVLNHAGPSARWARREDAPGWSVEPRP